MRGRAAVQDIALCMALGAVLGVLARPALGQADTPSSAAPAVQAGNQASARAAIDLALKAFDAGQVQAALNLLRPLATTGNHDAEYTLGQMLESMPGATFANYKEAAIWYLRAALASVPGAMNNLAVLHVDGRGVPVDYGVARHWYQKAANAGYEVSQYNLALMYGRGRGVPQDDAVMATWMQRAASAGYARAQAQFGRLYLDGRGVPANAATAAHWFRFAAMRSNAEAQYHLGVLLQHGAGLPRDLDEARLWLKRAAYQGHPLANWELARAYEAGIDVAADNELALSFYESAATANNIEAIERMQQVYRDGGLGQPADAAMAAYWSLKLSMVLSGAKKP